MPGLSDLTSEQRDRLTKAFADARRIWGPRAKLAAQVGMDVSTLQVLEGRRQAPLSEDAITRLTVAIGWDRDTWRAVADGAEPPSTGTVGRVPQGVDQVEETTLRFRRPEGMSDEEWAQKRAQLQGYWDALLDEAAQER